LRTRSELPGEATALRPATGQRPRPCTSHKWFPHTAPAAIESRVNIRNPAQEIERLTRRGKAEAACVAGMAEFGSLNLHVVRFQLWR